MSCSFHQANEEKLIKVMFSVISVSISRKVLFIYNLHSLPRIAIVPSNGKETLAAENQMSSLFLPLQRGCSRKE